MLPQKKQPWFQLHRPQYDGNQIWRWRGMLAGLLVMVTILWPAATGYAFSPPTAPHYQDGAFPRGPADDNTRSIGTFRIYVAPKFRPLLAGYPGYDSTTFRLQSPRIYDPATKIGRSDPHSDGDAADNGGTVVGTANTLIRDSDFSLVPSGGFNEGPVGTHEVHTEVRELNMTPIGPVHPHCPGIPGTVAVRAGIDAPAQPISPGEVESLNTGTDFPAESFFNVFAEVDLPTFASFPGGTLYNADPLLVINSNLTAFPPQVVYIHANSNAVPMLFRTADPGGAWAANEVFGWLVLAGHGIDLDCNEPADVETFQAIMADQVEMPLAAPAAGSFPGGPADDNTRSLGMFRLFVAEPFRSLMAGYPGYDNTTARLHSPFLYDPNTKIGRSDVHTDGDATDSGGTPVGAAGTMIADSDFSLVPSGDFNEGPAGTREVHTEVRELNMTPIGLTHPNCPGIPGSVAVRAGVDAPAQPFSPGEVESLNTGTDFPAESFFNVFAEVDMPAFAGFPGGTLYNADPLLVINNNLNAFPPQVVYVHANTNAVPMLFRTADPGGAWAANDLFGWLVLAGHGINFDCEKTEDVAQFKAVVDKLPELPLPEHFRCYDVLQEGPVDVTVGLRDQFGSEEVRVREPFVFCNPVEKRHNDQVTPINDPDAHLKFYHIVTQNQDPPRAVLVSNQFGEAQKLRVEKPLYLAVPTQKLSPKQHEFPKSLDHYKCYQASGKSVESGVVLSDQFYTDEVRVLDPVAFCNPTEKRHGDSVTPITQPKTHLTCYALEGPSHADLSVTTVNQFGDAGFVVRNSNLLCVPSTKDKVIEVDEWAATRALVGIQMPDGSLVNVVLSGPTTVEVDLTSLADTSDEAASPGAPDAANGLEEVRTELLSMQLTNGAGLTLRAGTAFGLPASNGQIEEKENKQPNRLDLPGPHAPFCTPPTPADCVGTQANSFFDVLFEVDVPLVGKLYNKEPLRVQAMIDEKPPKTRYIHVITDPIELFTAAGAPTGVFLVSAEHDTRPPLDHFQCYTVAQGEPANATVTLRDQFGTEKANVFDPDTFCNPAAKTHANRVTPIGDEDAHLTFYGIETANQEPPQAVLVGNQFGRDQRLKVGVARYLAVPTQKDPHAAPKNLDHFKCYQAEGQPINASVGLQDQFHMQSAVQILDPQLLCNPVEKEHAGATTPILHPDDHLVCYAIEGSTFDGANVVTHNQFVQGTLSVGAARMLCVPSSKDKVIEVDAFGTTRALVGVRLPNGSLVNVVLSGPATAEVALSSLGDRDSDSLEEVTTELVQMELQGSSPLGTIVLRGGTALGLPASPGQIEEKVNVQSDRLDLPGPHLPFCLPPVPADCQGAQANSYFDVLFELEVPGFGKLHNREPLRLEALIHEKPPKTTYKHVITNPIELFNANNQGTGLFLVTAQHATVPIEVDEFPHTIAVLELDTPQGRQFVRMRGPTTVNVLIDDSTGAAQDTDNNGLEQVETEMVQLDLRGYSSFGRVALQLNESKRSVGMIEERTNNTAGILDVAPFAETGVADSFFDIFVEIQVGDRVLHNETPVHMQSALTRKVPQPLEIFQSPADAQPIELVDANGQATGIRLVRVIHWPNPPIIVPPIVRTRAQLTLQTSQGKETITLEGPVTTNLFLDATCPAHDNDGNGRDEVPTEIVAMSLTGNSPTLGNVTMRLHNNSPSTGQLEEKNNATPGKLDLPPCTTQGTADSFFDIFVELEIPTAASAAGVNAGQSQVLHVATPIHLAATVADQNPLAGKTYSATFDEPLALLDENGNSSGITLVDGANVIGTTGLYLPLIYR